MLFYADRWCLEVAGPGVLGSVVVEGGVGGWLVADGLIAGGGD